MHAQATEKAWDELALEWDRWIGDEGDWNRRQASDCLLWRWIHKCTNDKPSNQITVLDAGCGTGYLTVQLAKQGFRVIGVDVSANQLDFARKRIEKFSVQDQTKLFKDSLDKLVDINNATVDLVVSNYVLMDMENYNGAMNEMYRVLKPNGHAIIIINHPCFIADKMEKTSDGSKLITWPPLQHQNNYFKESVSETSWGNFSRTFIYFHRPLSYYWKAFTDAGFVVTDLEEPGRESYVCPCAIGFVLKKS